MCPTTFGGVLDRVRCSKVDQFVKSSSAYWIIGPSRLADSLIARNANGLAAHAENKYCRLIDHDAARRTPHRIVQMLTRCPKRFQVRTIRSRDANVRIDRRDTVEVKGGEHK